LSGSANSATPAVAGLVDCQMLSLRRASATRQQWSTLHRIVTYVF